MSGLTLVKATKNRDRLHIESVTTSFDFVAISFPSEEVAINYRNVIEALHEEQTGIRNSYFPGQRVREYELTTSELPPNQVIWRAPYYEFIHARHVVTFNDVDFPAMCFLIQSLPFEHLVSRIELTLDFIVNDPKRFLEFLRRYLRMRYVRHFYESGHDNIVHFNNNRTASSKQGRSYIKNGTRYDRYNKYVRLEVCLLRNKLRPLGVKSIIDVLDFDGRLLTETYDLSKLPLDKFHQRYYNSLRRKGVSTRNSKAAVKRIKNIRQKFGLAAAIKEAKSYVANPPVVKHKANQKFQDYISNLRFFPEDDAEALRALYLYRIDEEKED